jgi:preprotein translocase subunit SecA
MIPKMLEVASRVIGQRHYDVQIMGGIVLHEGNVAEMKTGEGKTQTAILPLYLNALQGKGAHLVTVNDYLAQLHAGWMGEIYDFLGLTTGCIINDQSFVYEKGFDNGMHEDKRMTTLRPSTRKEAYGADVTYGTNNEFGFDYLRDNMVNEVDLVRQRELNFAIVDEVDSILIDEARTPLIISAPAAENPENYLRFAKLAATLRPEHYILDEKRKSVALTDDGWRTRFVDQNRVDLVHDREVQLTLTHQVNFIYHVVTQIIKPELVVCTVRDVCPIGFLARTRTKRRHTLVLVHSVVKAFFIDKRLIVDNTPCRESQKVINLAHPASMQLCKIIIDRHQVCALALKRVEIQWQNRCLSLSFSRFHLGHVSLMENNTPHDLHVIVTLADHAACHFEHFGNHPETAAKTE